MFVITNFIVNIVIAVVVIVTIMSCHCCYLYTMRLQIDCSRHTGESKPLALKAPVSAFCPASVDVFPVKAPSLGDLTHVQLSHNARGANSDWLVEMVRVVHVGSQQEWLFFGHVWLHNGNGNQVTLTRGQLLNACIPCCTCCTCWALQVAVVWPCVAAQRLWKPCYHMARSALDSLQVALCTCTW